MKQELTDSEQKKPPMTKGDLMTVRAMCLMKGSTFTHWLRGRGFKTDTAFNALLGRRHGPISRRIRDAVHAEFGV